MYSIVFFFFKQKTAYEMRISDWSSDVCSSDLPVDVRRIEFSGTRASGCRPFCRFLLFPQFRARLSACALALWRSEEHTSELQSLMRISYAVFCLKNKQKKKKKH